MDPEEDKNEEVNQSPEPKKPEISIGGVSTDYSVEDDSYDSAPVQQTTVRGLGTDKDGNQIEVRGLQFQAEKQKNTQTYTSESELQKSLSNKEKLHSHLKIGSIFLVIFVFLLLIVWFFILPSF